MPNKDEYERLAKKFLGKEENEEIFDEEEEVKTEKSKDIEEEDTEETKKTVDADISEELDEIKNDMEEKAKKSEEEDADELEEEAIKLADKKIKESEKPKEDEKKEDKDVEDDVDLTEEEEEVVNKIVGGSGSLTGVKSDVLAGNIPEGVPQGGSRYGSGWSKVANSVGMLEAQMYRALKRMILERRSARFWKKMFMEEKKKNAYNDIVNSKNVVLSDKEIAKVKKILDKCETISSIDYVRRRIKNVINERVNKAKEKLISESVKVDRNIKRFLED